MAMTISVRQLAEKVSSGEAVELLDVRTPEEFTEVRVPFAKSVPLDQFDGKAVAAARTGAADAPLYVICRSGYRSQLACDNLKAAGFANAINVEGGTLAWEKAGYEVARG